MAEPIPPPPPNPSVLIALFDLLKVLGLIVALGLAQAWEQTFGALFKWLGSKLNFSVFGVRPLGFLAHDLAAAASHVQHFFGSLALAREPGMTTFLTLASNTQKATPDEVAALSATSDAALNRMQHVFTPWFVNTKTHGITKAVGHVTAVERAHAKSIAKTNTRVNAARAQAVKANRYAHTRASTAVIPRVGTLEHWEKTAKADLKKLGWILPYAGLLTFGLALVKRLGLSWLRCPNVTKMGKKVCNAPSHWLDELLGLVADYFFVTHVCTLLGPLERAASDIGEPLVVGLTVIGAGICKGGIGAPPKAADPQLFTPPVVASLTAGL